MISPDSFFRGGTNTRVDPVARPANCDCRRQRGFCGACIHPACLRITSDGTVRVGLSAAPEHWFEMLAALGNALQLTRNSIAVLGQIAPLPALSDWRHPILPRDAAGNFAPNLAEHASLWAVREPAPLGPAYGFEMRDAAGFAFHRIVLTAPANSALFQQFVTDHQSPPEEAAGWYSPNHAASAQRRAAFANRIAFLQSRLARGASDVHPIAPVAILNLLRSVANARFPIRTTHYTPALIRSANWTPETIESPSADNQVAFLHGNQTGLHLALPALASAWLWRGRCNCCDKEQWTVELGAATNRLGLAIACGDAGREEDWRALLTHLTA